MNENYHERETVVRRRNEMKSIKNIDKETSVFSPAGSSVSIDLWGVAFGLLNNPAFLCVLAKKAAEKAKMRVLNILITPFHPQGLSILITLSQSHLSLHCTPESGYVGIDVFTCGGGNPLIAAEYICRALKPTRINLQGLPRGMNPKFIDASIQKKFERKKN